MPEFRKGSAAIEEDKDRGGGNFQPFLPQVKWSDGEEKFILVLTPIEETIGVDLHEWIKVGSWPSGKDRYESFISRKDEGIGEDYDDIEDRLDRLPRRRTLGVAVELEPVMGDRKGRQVPVGFTIKTETFTKQDEEVEAPLVGLLVQASKNFFGYLNSYDNSKGPVTETVFQVLRDGDDGDTRYDFMPYEDMDVDFSPLFDNLVNVGYLGEEDAESLLDEIEKNYDEEGHDAASLVGVTLLNKRIEELADENRYKEFIEPIEELPRGKYDKLASETKAKREKRQARPERKSPRKARATKSRAKKEETNDEAPSDDSEAKAKRFAELRAGLDED
jgi:hypothetical protein